MLEWKLYVIRKRLEQRDPRQRAVAEEVLLHPQLLVARDHLQGLLLADQVERFYTDLADERFVSRRWPWCISATAPTRFPPGTWPIRSAILAHNGEINTLRGNVNWMRARESMLASEKYGADLKKIVPDLHARRAATRRSSTTRWSCCVLTGRSLAAGDVDADPRAVGRATRACPTRRRPTTSTRPA